jgi:hypothetical protein
MKRKHCDIMVVNNPHTEGAAFAHDTNVVTVIGKQGVLYENTVPESKHELALRILNLTARENSLPKKED